MEALTGKSLASHQALDGSKSPTGQRFVNGRRKSTLNMGGGVSFGDAVEVLGKTAEKEGVNFSSETLKKQRQKRSEKKKSRRKTFKRHATMAPKQKRAK